MLKPQFSVSWVRTKKDKSEKVPTIVEPIPVEYVDAAKEVLTNTVESTEAAVNRLGVKAVIGGIIIGGAVVILHTGGQILVNALNRPTTD